MSNDVITLIYAYRIMNVPNEVIHKILDLDFTINLDEDITPQLIDLLNQVGYEDYTPIDILKVCKKEDVIKAMLIF